MKRRMVLPALLALGASVLFGCNSSDNSTPNSTTNDVTITLTQSQDVREVIVYHEVDNNLWDPIFDQQYTGQSSIGIPLTVVVGDRYRVQAAVAGSGGNVFTFEDFVAGNGDVTFGEPGTVRTGASWRHLIFSVPAMPRLTQPTPVAAR